MLLYSRKNVAITILIAILFSTLYFLTEIDVSNSKKSPPIALTVEINSDPAISSSTVAASGNTAAPENRVDQKKLAEDFAKFGKTFQTSLLKNPNEYTKDNRQEIVNSLSAELAKYEPYGLIPPQMGQLMKQMMQEWLDGKDLIALYKLDKYRAVSQ